MVWMHIYQSVVQTNREGKCVVLNHGMNVGGGCLDWQRWPEGSSPWSDHAMRFIWVLRRSQSSRNPFLKFVLRRMRERYGLEIPRSAKIGPGFYLGHAFNITVNDAAIIGANCNLHKGVTIGQENRGSRKGVPVLGDCVWVGVNATIVGGITVGDDVLIAPGAYVNCNVPSHSIVLGNPCRIISRENATDSYINRRVQLV